MTFPPMALRHAAALLFALLLAGGTASAAQSDRNVEHPVPRSAPRISVEEIPLPRAGGIMVFGASRGLGLEIVRELVGRGEKVMTMVREGSDFTALQPMNVSIVIGDALSPEDIKAAFTVGAVRAVISAVGGRRGETRPDFEGNRTLIDMTKETGIERFVLVSMVGAGDSAEAMPKLGRWLLRDVLPLKTQAEDYLKAAGLQHTIVRPGIFRDRSASGQAQLTEDTTKFSYISRADAAKLVVDAVLSDGTIGKVYTAYDPTLDGLWAMFK